jgi:uncharacterized glyoxalase superfamily protein PhnB
MHKGSQKMAQPDMLGMAVKDIPTSLKFYRLLGLDIPESTEDHVEFVTAGGFRIAWDEIKLAKDVYPNWVEPVGHRMTLAFKCADAAEVNALYDKAIKAGYQSKAEPWDAFWGQRYAVVVDPDGNNVDLFAWV